MQIFSFQTQLRAGDTGEALFLQKYPGKIKLYPGREYDFTCEDTGRKLELKTDTYPMAKTENFFMERYSDNIRKTNGGPWRTAADGIDDFFYLFLHDRLCFHFDNPPALVAMVEKIIKDQKLRPMFIKNKTWTTSGYKIKRLDLAALYKELKFGD